MLEPSLHLNYRHGHDHLSFIRRALLTRTHLSHPLLTAGGNMGLSKECLPVGSPAGSNHAAVRMIPQLLKVTSDHQSISWLESPVRPKHSISKRQTGIKRNNILNCLPY